jgi:hypothetical protein
MRLWSRPGGEGGLRLVVGHACSGPSWTGASPGWSQLSGGAAIGKRRRSRALLGGSRPRSAPAGLTFEHPSSSHHRSYRLAVSIRPPVAEVSWEGRAGLHPVWVMRARSMGWTMAAGTGMT